MLAAALVLTGCSAGSFLHFGKGSGGSTVQKIDRPAVESAELQFAHPAAGDTIAVFDTSAGVFKAVLSRTRPRRPMITLRALCRQATTTA